MFQPLNPRARAPLQKVLFMLILILILMTNSLLPVSARSNAQGRAAAGDPVYPTFNVQENEDWVGGDQWLLGTTVTLAINNPGTPANPDYSGSQTVGSNPKDPSQTYVEFNLKGVFDIQPGFLASLSDGTTTKTHTVTSLTVTDIDLDNDLVNGTAAAGTLVDVWACDGKTCSNRHIDAGGDGSWSADFAHKGFGGDEQTTFDILAGSNGGSRQCDADKDCTQFNWSVPNPTFNVRANDDWVGANQWPLGNTVTLEIDDPATPGNPDYSDSQTVGSNPKDPSQTYAEFNLKGVFDIQPGFLVSLSDGATTKTHTVTSLTVTGVDVDNDLVNGTAAAGTQVDVWACDGKNCYNRHLNADGDGKWTADFAHKGTGGDEQTTLDIVAGTNGDSGQCDEDRDCTQFNWSVPNPTFNVRANDDWVGANQWPLGDSVTLEIDNPGTPANPDYSDTQSVGSNPKDPSQTYAEFNLKGVFDIQPGFLVSLSDGTTTKTHTVTALAVTGVDLDKDLVSGTAAAGARVDLWSCDGKNCYNRHVDADDDGKWTADFAHKGIEGDEQTTLDIVAGTNGDSGQCDEDGDCTQFSWNVANPTFNVRANEERVEAYQWSLGATVTVEIDDPATLENPDYSDTQTVAPMPKDPSQTYVDFNLKGVFDIQPGFLVSLSDSATTKTHTVTSLTVTNVDVDNDLVNGTAAAGTRVDVWACDGKNCYNRHLNADGDGKWTADFAHKGIEGDEQTTLDIVAGTNGDSSQCDDDKDCTQFGWSVPNPSVNVRANFDEVEGYQWTLGATVTLEIDDPATPGNPNYSDSQSVGTNPKDPSQTYVDFRLMDIFDIQPGFLVSLSDGTITKRLTVSDLAFTRINVNSDLVSGVADPNVRVNVWACDDTNCYNRHATTEVDGSWTVDFSQPGSEGNEQELINIVTGTWIDSSQADDDGDNTMFGMTVPLYYTIYLPMITRGN